MKGGLGVLAATVGVAFAVSPVGAEPRSFRASTRDARPATIRRREAAC